MIFVILLRLLGVTVKRSFPDVCYNFGIFFYSDCRRYEVITRQQVP